MGTAEMPISFGRRWGNGFAQDWEGAKKFLMKMKAFQVSYENEILLMRL